MWQRLSAGPPIPVPWCPQRPACPGTLIPVLDPHRQLLGRRPQDSRRRWLLLAPPWPALQAASPARADGSRPARPTAQRWPPPPASCPTSSLCLGPVARGGLIISSFLGQLQAPASPRLRGGGPGTPRLSPQPWDWGSRPAASLGLCSLFLFHLLRSHLHTDSRARVCVHTQTHMGTHRYSCLLLA